MSPGTIDFIILVLVFIALQAWWIIPLLKKNKKLNERGKDLSEEIKRLEKLYRKKN